MYVGRVDCGGLRQNKSLIVITSARNQPRFNSFKISFSINNKGVSKGESALFLNFEYLPKNNIPVVKRFMILIKGSCKKNFLGGDIFPKSVYPPTHPRVFVGFGKTKGEIWVEKGDFRGNLGGF